MFVSSYNTYIQTNTTDKTNRTKEVPDASKSKLFASKLLHTSQITPLKVANAPINYIDNSKIFNNRQKLQQNIESKKELASANKFNTFNSLTTAKRAYSDNSTMFSIVAKPKNSLSKENITGHEFSKFKAKISAINTYLQNNRYYQITA